MSEVFLFVWLGREEKEKMDKLRNVCDGVNREPISCLYNRDGVAFQLYKLEETIEVGKERYWAVIVEKCNLDSEDVECVLDVENVFEEYIKL